MKVTLIQHGELGAAGTIAEGPEVWRACFPAAHPIMALPADVEAEQAVAAELATVHPQRRQHLEWQMRVAREQYEASIAPPDPLPEATTAATAEGAPQPSTESPPGDSKPPKGAKPPKA